MSKCQNCSKMTLERHEDYMVNLCGIMENVVRDVIHYLMKLVTVLSSQKVNLRESIVD